jgi:excisionase family DNA binding protein
MPVHERAPESKLTQQMHDGTQVARRGTSAPVLVVCILRLPCDVKTLLNTLSDLESNVTSPVGQALADALKTHPDSEHDPWLAHSEAAEYLGVAASTLYRYACQQRIEARKLAGRLEYRRSTLEQFKQHQIRPARRTSSRDIITPTLGSGK